MAGALIVTAEMAREELAWLDSLRRAHYPSDRNQLPAHLTMFRALPPSSEQEVRSRLSRAKGEAPPSAWIEGLMDLGGGVAFRVVSPDLDRIRADLADDFHGLLSSQDISGWRPHVTIQNKVPSKEARALVQRLESEFRPRRLLVTGLGLYRYLSGPWQHIATAHFRGR